MRSRRYLVVLIATVLALAALWQWRRAVAGWRECSGVVWTTDYHVLYHSKLDLDDSVQSVFQEIDQSASVYNQTSRIAVLNRDVSVLSDPILDTLFSTSLLVNRQSGGAYDPTVMPLVNAWGFGYREASEPTGSQVDSILEFVGLDKVRLADGRLVKSDERVQVDFSSIAKGLACDRVGDMFRRNGVSDFLVEIGGEVASGGVNRKGQAWRVSVDLPTDQDTAVVHDAALVLAVTDCGVATSGSYRRFTLSGGERRSHIINPVTGQALTSDLLSVTVVAPTCMLADAWATACMVLGAERTALLMQRRDDLGVLTISRDGQGRLVVWSNARLAALVAP